MAKYWNNNKTRRKTVEADFLIEVMALDCLYGSWSGQFDPGDPGHFATLAQRICGPGRILQVRGRRSVPQWTRRESLARRALEKRSSSRLRDQITRAKAANGEALKLARFGRCFPSAGNRENLDDAGSGHPARRILSRLACFGCGALLDRRQCYARQI